MKILVVHRQKEVIEQVKSVLCDSNAVIFSTDSGLDGLLTSRIEKFDLIICSTDLPVITGFELVRTIRNNSVNKGTPVIFLSEEVDEKIEHLGNALGVAAMLANKEMNNRLASIVHERVHPEPDKSWNDILSHTRLN
jgi:CheY-like chemotaxis protein